MSDSLSYSFSPSDRSQTVTLSFWKKELQLGTNGPPRPADWRFHIVVGLQVKIHRLLADLENLAKASADRKTHLFDGASQFAVMIGELTRYQPSSML